VYGSPRIARHVALVAVATPDMSAEERVVVRQDRDVDRQALDLRARKKESRGRRSGQRAGTRRSPSRRSR
jgi:hypothetical protein